MFKLFHGDTSATKIPESNYDVKSSNITITNL